MRVTINHKEKKWSFRNTSRGHAVLCKVDFSEEEKQIIKERKLKDFIIMNRPLQAGVKPDPSLGIVDSPLHVWQLLEKDPNMYVVATPSQAKQYEYDLKEALKNFKQFIEDNAEVGDAETTFEL
jgi:hypothetical protein